MIIHRYVKNVFAHGFAYALTGTALHGKKLILSFTAGATEEAYTPEGFQHFKMESFMPPFVAMANLCGLKLLDPIYSFGMMVVNPDDVEHNKTVIEEAKKQGAKLADVVNSL